MDIIHRTLIAPGAYEIEDTNHAYKDSEALDASIRFRVQNLMRFILCTAGVSMSMRSFLTEKCFELQAMLNQEDVDLTEVTNQIHEIVQTSYFREELLANEGLMLNVNLLDLAVNDYRKSLMMQHAPVQHQQAV